MAQRGRGGCLLLALLIGAFFFLIFGFMICAGMSI